MTRSTSPSGAAAWWHTAEVPGGKSPAQVFEQPIVSIKARTRLGVSRAVVPPRLSRTPYIGPARLREAPHRETVTKRVYHRSLMAWWRSERQVGLSWLGGWTKWPFEADFGRAAASPVITLISSFGALLSGLFPLFGCPDRKNQPIDLIGFIDPKRSFSGLKTKIPPVIRI